MTLAELYDHLAPILSDLPCTERPQNGCRVPGAEPSTVLIHNTALQSCTINLLPRCIGVLKTILLPKAKVRTRSGTSRTFISRLFRLAEEQHLFSLSPPIYPTLLSSKRPPTMMRTPRKHGTLSLLCKTGLSHLQEAFTTFAHLGHRSCCPRQKRSLRKRPQSVEDYRQL